MQENSMKIFPYPSFEEVFTDKTLEGVFYPLCSIEYVTKESVVKLHFISSNGLWMDEDFSTKTNTFSYTLFNVVDGRYQFCGDIRLYKGFLQAKEIFPKLVADFEANGNSYLHQKLSTEAYIAKQISTLDLSSYAKIFDIEYYLQTFYEFSINQLYYRLHHEFAAFGAAIGGFGKAEKSPIVYGAKLEDAMEVLQYSQPAIEDIQDYHAVGQVIGCEFFTDGNDTILLYNALKHRALCVNFYS